MKAGALPLLVQMLSCSMDEQAAAMRALRHLTLNEKCKVIE